MEKHAGKSLYEYAYLQPELLNIQSCAETSAACEDKDWTVTGIDHVHKAHPGRRLLSSLHLRTAH